MERTRTRNAGFTLLELIVVVSILAVVGGALVVAYDGLESRAAKGTATHSMAALDNAVRAYTVIESAAPNELDSLVAASFTASGPAAGAGADLVGNLGSKLGGKFIGDTATVGLTAVQVGNLRSAGISTLRWVDINGNQNGGREATVAIVFAIGEIDDGDGDPATGGQGGGGDDGLSTPLPATAISIALGEFLDLGTVNLLSQIYASAGYTAGETLASVSETTETGTAHALDAPAQDGSVATVGDITDIDIPNRVFDTPRPGSNRNRGRGFAASFDENSAFAIWDEGAGGINNVKIGADPGDTLVVFGLGNSCSMVGSRNAGVRSARLASAPYYADVARNEYGRYNVVYNVDVSPARLVAVLDARGDFLDEEFAEATGQKQ